MADRERQRQTERREERRQEARDLRQRGLNEQTWGWGEPETAMCRRHSRNVSGFSWIKTLIGDGDGLRGVRACKGGNNAFSTSATFTSASWSPTSKVNACTLPRDTKCTEKRNVFSTMTSTWCIHPTCYVCVGGEGVVWSILMAGSIITDLGPLISCNRKSFWYTARAINLVIWPCSQTWEQISSTRSIMSMCLLFSEKLIYSINKYCVLVFIHVFVCISQICAMSWYRAQKDTFLEKPQIILMGSMHSLRETHE